MYLSDGDSRSVVSDSLRPHGLFSLPGSSVHGLLQARLLEWVAVSFSKCVTWLLGKPLPAQLYFIFTVNLT